MLLSMTGYGEASQRRDDLSLAIELRAVNNRHLKVSLRAADPYHLLEAEVEKVVRRTVKRGTIQVHLRCDKQASAQDFRINPVALRSYLSQVRSVAQELGLGEQSAAWIGALLELPGVVPEAGSMAHALHDDWPLIEKVLEKALAGLQVMRQEEGRAMAQELLTYRDTIAGHLERIRQRIPHVAGMFRERLLERVRKVLGDVDVQIDKSDLIKEVAIYAERGDISEEIVRLSSHLGQFQVFMNETESPGKKLDFLTQEMFREANTIGSKAADVDISREVVEVKSTLEKIRELVQNVE